MRFLTDKNLSYRLTAHLHDGGHDALHVDDVGLGSADDIAEALSSGAVVAIGPDVMRVRRLPMR